jgi:tubulin--tyrosine ligase
VSGRKFHIRAYVLCVGSVSVYVYSEALALFAGEPYTGYQCFHCQEYLSNQTSTTLRVFAAGECMG